MKKMLSIAILIVFSFLLLGQFFVFELALEQNREAMVALAKTRQTNIPGSVVISLTKEEAKGCIDDNEISWQGHRYDIISSTENLSGYQITAINDGVEESLLTSLDEKYSSEGLKNSPIPLKNSKLTEDLLKDYALPLFFSAKPITLPSGLTVNSVLSAEKIHKGYPKTLPEPPKSKIC